MIRPAYKSFYGRAWRRYRARLLEVRGAWCRDCGRAVSSYINLSHETHDPLTSSIRIRCAGCHARADAGHRAAVVRRRRAEACGQLWLSAGGRGCRQPGVGNPGGRARGAPGRIIRGMSDQTGLNLHPAPALGYSREGDVVTVRLTRWTISRVKWNPLHAFGSLGGQPRRMALRIANAVNAGRETLSEWR